MLNICAKFHEIRLYFASNYNERIERTNQQTNKHAWSKYTPGGVNIIWTFEAECISYKHTMCNIKYS